MSSRRKRNNQPVVTRKRGLTVDDDNNNNAVNNDDEGPTIWEILDDDDDDKVEAEEEDTSALVGFVDAIIVGIRYYTGTAHEGEYVTLQREPRNPYDTNAIRVDNLQGEKVGHIKATMAKVLAPWMDRAKNLGMSVVGTIPYSGNSFTMPVTIQFIAHAPQEQLDGHARSLEQQLKKSLGRQFLFRSSLLANASEPQSAARAGPAVESKRMDWTRQAAELDQLFEKQTAQQLCNLPTVAIPTELQTSLLDYQQAGLQWLVQQDTEPKLPFYAEKTEQGRKVWHCEITNASQAQKPEPFRGGILADEMGLGKTLQIISLLLASPPASISCPQCTLIVCPVSVMANWEQQIRMHVQEGALRVGFYQGPTRNTMLPQIKSGKINVLLVSYNTLSAEYSKAIGTDNQENKKKKRKVESLFDHDMHRMVLDEAHLIRNSKTQIFKACKQVSAKSKWCLTGTPFVNRADDIFSLFSVIGVQPLSDRHIYQRAITLPIQQGDEAGLACLRFAMAHVALRRSKATAGIQLVDKTVNLTSISFDGSQAHKQVYDALFGTVRAAFQAVLQDGDKAVLKNYSCIFEKLMRLRQACCSAQLVPPERRERALQLWRELQQRGSSEQQLTAKEGLTLLEKLKGTFHQDEEVPECAVCLTEMDESECVILRTCNHVYCSECVGRVAASSNNPSCPLCRKTFAKNDMIKKSIASIAAEVADDQRETYASTNDDSITTSPKVLALLETIKTSMKTDEKGVIFSQFTGFLDLIQEGLKQAGHSFTRIDGSMTTTKRMNAVQEFSSEEEASPRFILCSLHAAGTGINLTRGSVAFMMDCWWNSAVEAQAMDRLHRIGQSRSVTIYRFVMKGSLEERIVALQEAKNLQAKGALMKLNQEEQRQARLRDLKGLLLIEN